jgi:tetratricopeptide (TPR) repeat protein
MEAIHSQLLTPAGKGASILDQLEEEQDNIRTALQWTLQAGEVGVGLRLAGLLGEFWYYHSHLREGCQWLEQLLAQAGDTPVPISVRARALNALGGLLWPLQDMERARRTLEESLALFRDLEDQWWIADVLNNLGNLSMNTGDLEQALRYHEEALALRRALGDRRARQSLFGLGLITEQLGAYDRAAVFYEEADALARAAGGPAPYPSRGMGRVALQRNDLAKALAYFRESLGLFWGVGMKEGVAWCLLDIARAAALAGQPERAVRLFGAAETTLQVIGVPIGWDNPQANGVALLQAQVAAAEWQSAYAAGRALPLEQAVAAAMQDAD